MESTPLFAAETAKPITQLDGRSLDMAAEKLAQLRKLMPEAFSEGKLDLDKLRLVLGEDVYVGEERYGLGWARKNEAYQALLTPIKLTLAPRPDDSINWESSNNLFIEGENLETLHVLQKSYFGKVKLVYIDPPYNTGSDSFVYPDKFSEAKKDYLTQVGDLGESGFVLKEKLFRSNGKESGHFHSNWLSMMLPRVSIAHNLLGEDGVFIVSIDDNEAYTLKLLLDEVFGEQNFAGNIIWNSTKSVTNTALISVSHTHNLVYFKNLEYHKKNRYSFRLPDTDEGFSNPDNDPRGPWKADPFQVEGERPNQLYEIINPKTGQVYKPNPGNSWKNEFIKFTELQADNRIVFGTTGEAGPQRKRFWSEAQERGRVAKTLWTDVSTTSNGTSYLESLIGKKVFTNPKPVDLVQRFVQLGTQNDGDIVLDFFGGSGTTAEAVMRQNIADGKHRRFIFVTLNEPVDASTQAGKNAKSLGFDTISEVARHRIIKAIEAIKQGTGAPRGLFEQTDTSKFDLGFKAFRCTESNFKVWQSKQFDSTEELKSQLQLFADTQREDANSQSIIWELLLQLGYQLSTPVIILNLAGVNVASINSNEVIFVAEPLNSTALNEIQLLAPRTLVCLENIFGQNDSEMSNIQLQLSNAGISFKTI